MADSEAKSRTKVLSYNDPTKLKPGIGEYVKNEYTVTQKWKDQREGSESYDPDEDIRSSNPNNLAKSSPEYIERYKLEKKINDSRKKSTPTYYNSVVDESRPISSDTESALAIVSAENKRRAIDYLKLFADAGTSNSGDDYNDLLLEYATQQVANSSQAKSDIQSITSKFNDFKDDLFENVPVEIQGDVVSGLQPIVSAMVRGLGKIGEIEDRIKFRDRINETSSIKYHQQLNDGLKQEMRSWIRVIASYL